MVMIVVSVTSWERLRRTMIFLQNPLICWRIIDCKMTRAETGLAVATRHVSRHVSLPVNDVIYD
jgi:hypothetical protein